MVLRWLLLVILGAVVVWRLGVGRRSAPPVRGPAPSRPTQLPATMIACTHCGVHLPADESLVDGQGRPYCSPAHRQAGAQA